MTKGPRLSRQGRGVIEKRHREVFVSIFSVPVQYGARIERKSENNQKE
jgi:hypothetical protein